jgi:hypothetical protein
MFSEILFKALIPLLQDNYSLEEIQTLSVNITKSIEINPREGSNIPLIRDSILKYLHHQSTLDAFRRLSQARYNSLSSIKQLSDGIQDLDKLSTSALKSKLLAYIEDKSLAQEIYNLNFGYKQKLGEILYHTRFNQGGKRF